MAYILAILSLYWAVLFHVEENLSSLIVWAIDFDGQMDPYKGITPIVGPQVVQAAEKLIAPTGSLSWLVRSPADFNYDPFGVRGQIYDFRAWAAITINENATSLLRGAIQNGNASYDPMGAAQTVIVTARDDTNHSSYIDPQLMMFEPQSHEHIWRGQYCWSCCEPKLTKLSRCGPSKS
jgi:hypothetical protein